MDQINEFTVPEELEDERLDAVIASLSEGQSRSYVKTLIKDGSVLLNGKAAKPSTKVRENDVIKLVLPEKIVPDILPENIPLDIRSEDDDLLVVNKPKGMVVHPAPGNYTGTLVNALMYHCGDQLSSINGVIRPRIVHRIDKDTSGLLVVAKSDRAHAGLARQLEEHSINRLYRAIVYSNIKEDEGTVDAAIGRDPGNRLRNAVIAKGAPGYESARSAVTHYRVLERFGKYTLIEAKLETGRTHQIRVHMAHIKHPLLGDELYGPAKNREGAKRQMLHAAVLGFVHPVTEEYLEFESPLPEDFTKVLNKLRG